LELNRTCQLLVYAEDVNLLGEYINAIKRKKEAVVGVRQAVGVEVNAGKIKYTVILRHENEYK
jgi:hypothetical protein